MLNTYIKRKDEDDKCIFLYWYALTEAWINKNLLLV